MPQLVQRKGQVDLGGQGAQLISGLAPYQGPLPVGIGRGRNITLPLQRLAQDVGGETAKEQLIAAKIVQCLPAVLDRGLQFISGQCHMGLQAEQPPATRTIRIGGQTAPGSLCVVTCLGRGTGHEENEALIGGQFGVAPHDLFGKGIQPPLQGQESRLTKGLIRGQLDHPRPLGHIP